MSIETELSRSTLIWMKDGSILLTHDSDHARALVEIVRLTAEVMRTKRSLFLEREIRGRRELIMTKLGRRFFYCSKADFAGINACFEEHRLNPLYHAFYSHAEGLWECGDRLRHRDLHRYQDAVKSIRAAGRDPKLKRTLDNIERTRRKNTRSVRMLLENLRLLYSKVVIVRVDLGYYSLHSKVAVAERQNVSLSQAREDRDTFLRFLRCGPYKHALAGYTWKLEYGPAKGYHFHLAAFFDGQKVRADIKLAQGLGEHWNRVITKGRGHYFNCNLGKESYELNGLGTALRGDESMWSRVSDAVMYLAKGDYFVRPKAGGNGRLLGIGGPYRKIKGNGSEKSCAGGGELAAS